MSRWKRSDPALTCSGTTDNWAILRVKSEEQSNNMKPALGRAKTDLGVAHGDGRVSPRGAAVLSQNPLHDLHGSVAGNFTGMANTSKPRKSTLKTEVNDRAKGGFKYWYQERPKPTKFGAYGIGSGYTVLGLGSAPRT
ncbi:hypothetical protein CAPTEDRAFT_225281 [Capitella teleta]|uniref:Uncharacterized protein n=1 Tax=Capitella teleta TaxID=283909 RepID=R7TXW7_CAPTE|nr:hypothetical protein CAPTEDRAFT_225281 [Capitella teleta]|eukprot:ELT98462.1 hypothetical protein CAPTEDRAFT_225281 [Capitella teleta]